MDNSSMLESKRLAALRSYHILDTLPEEEFDRLTRLASAICKMPMSLISLVDDHRQWFKSTVGIDVAETTKDVSFCKYTILGSEIMEVPDATRDDRFMHNPFVTFDPNIRFYAGYPLIAPGGLPLGALCVLDTKPGHLDEHQREALQILAEEVVDRIVKRRKEEEEGFIRRIFDLSNDLICVVDEQGIFRQVNPAFKTLLGWSAEEILGKPYNVFVYSDDQDDSDSYFSEMLRGDAKEMFLNRSLRKDGGFIYTQWISVSEKETGLVYSVGRDVSARIHREFEIKRANEFLEQTGEVSNIGGWEYDLISGKVYWTRQTYVIHEVGDAFDPSLEGAMSFYKDDVSRLAIEAAVKDALEKCQSYDLELKITTAKGRDIWIRAIGNVECVSGRCVRIYGTFQDIDERKRRELAFEETKELLDNVLHAASEVCIIATDEHGVISLFNSGAEQMTGYTAAEMVGKRSPLMLHDEKEVSALVHASSEEHGRELDAFEAFVFQASRMNHVRHEVSFVRKDGSSFLGSMVITAIKDSSGEVKGFLGVTTDVTEQREADIRLQAEQARLQAFVQHAPASVAMFDTEMRYITCSMQWMRDYGLSDRQITGLSVYEVWPSIPDVWKERYSSALKGEKLSCERDFWPGLNETGIYVRWQLLPWYQHDGSIGGIMFLTENVSERVRQEEELERARLLAEEANHAKSEFLASMSHEIRTPLNGVIGFTDLVLKTDLDDTQRHYLHIVSQSGNSLLEIINDILDFSKIESGKLELDHAEFDLYEMASQAANVISYQAQKKRVEMLLNISPDLPRFVSGDEIRIKQIIINLLSNAVKFTAKGEIELKISVVNYTRDKVKLRFKVRDTGIGIKQDRQSRIFEAFTQEDVSTTKKYGGTGLGLTISNRLLSLMNSRMDLVSSPGKGSTFFFDLELEYRDGSVRDWDGLDRIHSVLIVDDNANNRTILKEMFILKQIKVDDARNGMEALSKIAAGSKYDLVILDYYMPFLNGIETAEKIKQGMSEEEKPIIALLHSSAEDSEILKSLNRAVIDLNLNKPVKIDDLFGALSRFYQKEVIDSVTTEKDRQLGDMGGLTVLIAEDNPVNMLLAKTMVARVAPLANIVEATNGEIAVARFLTAKPDLILMDVQMPEMNGYEATRKIRESDLEVPIIALTAASIKGEREKCLEAGMNDYMTKPFIEKTLFDMFDKWLSKAEDELDSVDVFALNDNSRHFDLNAVSAYLANDRNLIDELLKMTVHEIDEIVNALKLNRGVYAGTELQRIGQKLYGTATAASMKELSALALQLEDLPPDSTLQADRLIDAILKEIFLVKLIIKKEW